MLSSKPNHDEPRFVKPVWKTPFLNNKEYAWSLLGESCRNLSMSKTLQTTTFVRRSNVSPPPDAPLPSGSPSGSLRNWIVGIVLTFILPFFTHKWGSLLLLKRVAKSAHVADDLINKVEDAEDKLESLIIHENSKGDELPLKIREDQGITSEEEKNVDSVVEEVEEVIDVVKVVAEAVDMVAEKIADDLQDGSKLKTTVELVEQVAETVAGNAQKAVAFIDEVQEAEKKLSQVVEPVKQLTQVAAEEPS
ncbi:hypothetical protein E3N88_10813 [Mikania micrantha]|uniref:Uncharacterized protein n=1 Tax=Mikania micrantha TaxID=192012 RepID=A0A5N6PDG6_9ASTR|nr:hypothetical protein E3N88_10813 [Mikania micrantha]